ncbi:dynein axonemal assembly factor 19 [Brachyhypopomus gauderio]|uniref:dynein axonemal assembly factor 19 n=1 Tax=Brachyhypopomus gauderio TaxID=698409 RepID=UPI004041A6D6
MENSDIIDFLALEKELKIAVEADKKYQRENDAKFRAIRQKVASYEEFRDIVLASHLKPLEKRDTTAAPRKQPWNSVAAGYKEQKGASADIDPPLQSDFQPTTALEFSRDWRRFGGSSNEKYGLLVRLGGDTLQGIFSVEVESGLLGEFLVILSQCMSPGDEAVVMGLLEGLSKTRRFSLSVSLLSQAEQKACEGLFHRLWDALGRPSTAPQNPQRIYSEDPGLSEAGETRCAENTLEDKTDVAGKLKCLMAKYGLCESA